MRTLTLLPGLTLALSLALTASPAHAGDAKPAGPRPAKSKAGAKASAAKVAKTGNLVGKVTFKGEPPARAALDRSTDPVCSKTKMLAEDIVVTSGGLRDVIVMLPNGSAGTHAAPEVPALITQKDCMYRPRVLGVMTSQKLAVDNDDPTYHNVRGNLAKKILWNLGQPAKAPRILRDNVGKPGEVVTLHCDVHPWMRAFAVVVDHPFFVVTGDDGAYALENVPAGTYELQAWHPVLQKVTAKVTVKPGVTAKLDLAFSAANLPQR